MSLPLSEFIKIADRGDRPEVEPVKPYFALSNPNGESMHSGLSNSHEWLFNLYNAGLEHSKYEANEDIVASALYKGLHYWSQDKSLDFRDSKNNIRRDDAPIYANYIQELGRQRTSKLTAFIPGTRVIPSTAELTDREAAKSGDKLLDYIKYKNKHKQMMRRCVTEAYKYGEQPLFIEWNKDAGSIKKEWQATADIAEKEGHKSGKVKVKLDGKFVEIDLDNPEHEGDVEYNLWTPYMIGYAPFNATCIREIEGVYRFSYQHVEKIKRDYPNIKHPYDSADYEAVPRWSYNHQSMQATLLEDHDLVIEYFGRSSKYLRGGVYMKITEQTELEKPQDLPYDRLDDSEWGNIPMEMIKDIDYVNQVRGGSTVHLLKNLQHKSNKFITDMVKNVELAARAKLFLPKGSGVGVETIADSGVTVVKYNAPYKPEFASNNAVNVSALAGGHELLKSEFFQLGGSGPVSQGDVPKGVKSGVALRLVKQFEDIRNADLIEQLNEFIVAVDRKTLAIAKQYYSEDEERMLLVMGKDKKRKIESLKVSDLSKVHDVQIQDVNALSKEPAGKLQELIDLIEITAKNPEGPVYTNAQLIKILDYPVPEDAKDTIAESALAADWENEQLADGREVPEPRSGEDLLTHYKTHKAFYHGRRWHDLSEKAQLLFEEHMMATEFLMFEKMSQSPAYEQLILTTTPDFPSFSENYLDLMRASLGQGQAAQGQQAPVSQEQVAAGVSPAGRSIEAAQGGL